MVCLVWFFNLSSTCNIRLLVFFTTACPSDFYCRSNYSQILIQIIISSLCLTISSNIPWNNTTLSHRRHHQHSLSNMNDNIDNMTKGRGGSDNKTIHWWDCRGVSHLLPVQYNHQTKPIPNTIIQPMSVRPNGEDMGRVWWFGWEVECGNLPCYDQCCLSWWSMMTQ